MAGRGFRISAHADLDEGETIRSADGLLKDLSPLLNAIGLMTVAHSQAAFENQEFDGVPWKPRMNPNVPGVVTDVNAGRFPRPQRFTDRPALIDTGRLRGDISHRLVGGDVVEVGSRLPYASVLHLGGESESPGITQAGQKKLWEWMKRQGMGRSGAVRSRLAKARQKAAERFSKGHANIWARARSLAVDRLLKADAAYQANMAALAPYKAALKASGKQVLSPAASVYVKMLNQRIGRSRQAAKAKVAAGGITNPLLRAAYKDLSAKLHARQGATMLSAQTAADKSLAAIKAKQDANPLFAAAASLRWLLSPTMVNVPRTIKHPARPFVGVPRELRQEVERQLGLRIGLA